MKIHWIHTLSYRNNEHFQYFRAVTALIEDADPVKLKIADLYAIFKQAFEMEDMVHLKIAKSSLTEKIAAADHRRDTTFRGINYILLGLLCHFDSVIIDAATRVKIVVDSYGNITKLPLNEETSAIYNLVQELLEKHEKDLEILKLDQWVYRLGAENDGYDALVMDRYAETAGRTQLTMKKCRAETDRIYNLIVERINAYIVTEGDAAYADFVGKLNAVIEKYENTMSMRKGRAKGKKDETEEETK